MPAVAPFPSRITAIYAVAENGVIGREGGLPWRLPADLQHFKRITLGSPVLMGRKTWLSLGRPLPGRRNVVVSRQAGFSAEGAEVYVSLEAALDALKDEAEVFIIGGAELLQQAFDKGYIGRVCQTLVHADVEGDTHFVLPDGWKATSIDARQADDKNEFAYTFVELLPE